MAKKNEVIKVDTAAGSRSYNRLDIQVSQTLHMAISHDEPIKVTKKQYKGFRFRMIFLWAILIIGMAGFTWVLHKNHEVSVAPADVVVETVDPTKAVTPEVTS